MKPKLNVGNELCLVISLNTKTIVPKKVTVTAVGTKWAMLDYPAYKPYRIALDSWQVDGGNYCSPGKCYVNESEYLEKANREKFYQALKSKLGYTPSENITSEDIKQAAKLLGVQID